MLGRDLTPQKIQARVPRVFWVNVLAEWAIQAYAVADMGPTTNKWPITLAQYALSRSRSTKRAN